MKTFVFSSRCVDMSDITVPDNALSNADVTSSSLTEVHLTILWTIALWYNGIGIERGSRVYHISCTVPPSLRILLGCSDEEWENKYKPAFEDLEDANLVDEKTILSKNTPWAPTEKFLKLTAELFADHLERIVVPHSAFNPNKGHIGDPAELLPHRIGVEQTLAWLNDAGYQWELYPGQRGHPRPDVIGQPVHPSGYDTMMHSNFEIISSHNNKAMYIKKYKTFTGHFRNTTWIFERRKAAGQAINFLSETDHAQYMGEDKEYPACRITNTPLNNPENYAIQTLNNYLRQSQERSECICTGMDHVQTITGISNDRDIDQIRKPVTVWNTATDEIDLLRPMKNPVGISVDELNGGANLHGYL